MQLTVGLWHLLLVCVHYFLLFAIHPNVTLQDKPGILVCVGISTYMFVCFHIASFSLISATALGMFLVVSGNMEYYIQMLYDSRNGASLTAILLKKKKNPLK